MDLLLDTHSFIWFLNGDEQLPANLKVAIANTSNQIFLSIASLWEIAIKNSLGKLELKGDFIRLSDFIVNNNIVLLPITFANLQQLLQLPFHHKDPFDRILIAQGISEGLTIATKDEVFTSYGVGVIWH